jgi:hypothetical protein
MPAEPERVGPEADREALTLDAAEKQPDLVQDLLEGNEDDSDEIDIPIEVVASFSSMVRHHAAPAIYRQGKFIALTIGKSSHVARR